MSQAYQLVLSQESKDLEIHSPAITSQFSSSFYILLLGIKTV